MRLFIFLLILFCSCNNDNSDCLKSALNESLSKDLAELRQNEDLWLCHTISDYNIVIEQFQPGCINEGLSVQVKNGSIIDSFPINISAGFESLCEYYTIQDLFNKIEMVVDESIPFTFFPEDTLYLAHMVRITYDEKYGYPKEVLLDILPGADDEFLIEISEFNPN